MKKTIYLISGLIIVVLIITVSLFFVSKNKKPESVEPVINTPTVVLIPTNSSSIPLQITATDPGDKKTNVPVNQIITITFNKNIAAKDISFSIQPSAQYVVNAANNQLFINFLTTLASNTNYSYSIKHNGTILNTSYTFTTADDQSASTNDNAAQTMKIWTRANRPDLFLYNQMPYTTTDFSVTGDLTTTEPYHYYFTVSLLGANQDQDKQEFTDWLISLGLTNDQIKILDIRYQ